MAKDYYIQQLLKLNDKQKTEIKNLKTIITGIVDSIANNEFIINQKLNIDDDYERKEIVKIVNKITVSHRKFKEMIGTNKVARKRDIYKLIIDNESLVFRMNEILNN